MSCQALCRLSWRPPLLDVVEGLGASHRVVQQQAQARQAVMLGGADPLVVGGVPDTLAQQQQAGLVGAGQVSAHLFQPWRQMPGFALFKLAPLSAHRAPLIARARWRPRLPSNQECSRWASMATMRPRLSSRPLRASSSPPSMALAACRPFCQAWRAWPASCCSTRIGQSSALVRVAQTMPRQISVQRATAWSNTCSGWSIAGRAMIATV
ncbi:hypothetical protein WR25_03486 [Diploscapter pachys]|uniref:Uncharacterized protein n=1 Tax=Diploscapter pachys TaxID=2018661 RepID=A0A2A2K5K1_9BILA|nr:hypothetical protein WR25_03486 [Diploscapter pachys]